MNITHISSIFIVSTGFPHIPIVGEEPIPTSWGKGGITQARLAGAAAAIEVLPPPVDNPLYFNEICQPWPNDGYRQHLVRKVVTMFSRKQTPSLPFQQAQRRYEPETEEISPAPLDGPAVRMLF